MNRIKIHKLLNGMTVIACNVPGASSVYFDMAIKLGSRYENKNNNGISHLIEHFISHKIRNSLSSHPWIKHSFESTINAYTMRYRTNYELEFSPHKIGDAVALFGIILNFNSISSETLITEKKIIREEILEDNDMSFDVSINKILYDNLYGKSSMALPILGTEKSLNRITLSVFNSFIKKYYQPSNIIFSISGDLTKFSVKKILDQLTTKKIKLESPLSPSKVILPKNKRLFQSFKSTQNYFGIFFPFISGNSSTNVEIEFFNALFSEYLYNNLRKEMSFYRMKIDVTTYNDISYLFVESFISAENYLKFIERVNFYIKNFILTLKKEDLVLFKQVRIDNINLQKSSVRDVANYASWNYLTFGKNSVISLDDQIDVIKKISLKKVKTLFEEIILNNNHTLHIYSGKNINKFKKKITKI